MTRASNAFHNIKIRHDFPKSLSRFQPLEIGLGLEMETITQSRIPVNYLWNPLTNNISWNQERCRKLSWCKRLPWTVQKTWSCSQREYTQKLGLKCWFDPYSSRTITTESKEKRISCLKFRGCKWWADMEVPTESLDKSLLEFNNLLSPANLTINSSPAWVPALRNRFRAGEIEIKPLTFSG